MPRIIINRTQMYPDSLRKYKIELDGQPAGSVGAGESLILEVAPGDHEVRARLDFSKSNKWVGSIGENDVVNLSFTYSPGSYLKGSFGFGPWAKIVTAD